MTPVMFIEGKLLLPGFPRPLERLRPRERVHSELRVSPASYVFQVRIETAPTDVGANRAFSARCDDPHSALAPSSRIPPGPFLDKFRIAGYDLTNSDLSSHAINQLLGIVANPGLKHSLDVLDLVNSF